jgi:hypothetical protein
LKKGENMPIIIVWGLPSDRNYSIRGLGRITNEIIDAVLAVGELDLDERSDVTCFYPAERVTDALTTTVVVQITGLFEKPKRTLAVRNLLARKVGEVVKRHCPEAKVEVFIFAYDPQVSGFFTTE